MLGGSEAERSNEAIALLPTGMRLTITCSIFFVCDVFHRKITDQSRGIIFRMWSHPPIPWFTRPCICKKADEPRLSGKPLNTKIGQVLRPIGAILSIILLKITVQSRNMYFWMCSYPLICQPSICKRSGQPGALWKTTKRQNWATIAA